MALGGAHFFLDEVEVVEQPFARGRDEALPLGDVGEQCAGFGEHFLVVAKPAQQAITAVRPRQLMPGGQVPAMQLHLVGGEQLRTKWHLVDTCG
ncbi:MAG TPA: hypothetical protein VLJ62_33595 [Burkholderiaceae bacterium]|nr:hypothetical protein [Burkholderiaceae bacterium]